MPIQIIHNNKTYSRFENEIKDLYPDVMLAGIYDTFKPFEAEINKCGGTLKLKVKPDLSWVDMEFIKIPEDLQKRISDAVK